MSEFLEFVRELRVYADAVGIVFGMTFIVPATILSAWDWYKAGSGGDDNESTETDGFGNGGYGE